MLSETSSCLRNNIFRKCLHVSLVKNIISCNHWRKFTESSILSRGFYEPNRRGALAPHDLEKHWLEHIKDGKKIFFEECKLFIDEVKTTFRQDRKIYKHGDTDIFFRFDNKECLKKWRIGSDKRNNEGFSECEFVINDKGKGVFYGNIDTTPPKDGKNRFGGYCGIKSVRKTKSFLREDCYEWSSFTHLELKVKGDGRNYAVNLGLGMYFDVNWFDTFSYPMFTRGGPYWQIIRIPFSKFFFQAKGRMQDFQQAIPLSKINSVGITAATVPGPFHLEIDYIGCHADYTHKEESAYELYKIPKEIVTD